MLHVAKVVYSGIKGGNDLIQSLIPEREVIT